MYEVLLTADLTRLCRYDYPQQHWVPHKWFALYKALFDYNLLFKQSKWWRWKAITYISLLIIPCMIVYVTNKQEPICSWVICTHKCCIKHFDHLDSSVSCRCAETATPTCLVCLVMLIWHTVNMRETPWKLCLSSWANRSVSCGPKLIPLWEKV